MTRVTLKKLSICPCGFPVLKDEIGLGAEYFVNLGTEEIFTFICGGCGKEQRVFALWVFGREGHKAGWMPKAIFEPLDK